MYIPELLAGVLLGYAGGALYPGTPFKAMGAAFLLGAGGGIIRDLILNRSLWVFSHPWYVFLVIGVGWFTSLFPFLGSRVYLVRLADAVGSLIFAVSVSRGLSDFYSPEIAALGGVVTALGGGFILTFLKGLKGVLVEGRVWIKGVFSR